MIKVPEQAVMIVVASRSEVIKMAPIYLACKRAHIPVLLCVTCYSPLVEQALSLFSLKPDIIMSDVIVEKDFLTTFRSILDQVQPVVQTKKPFLIMVHGDSVSSMAVAMAAFYSNIPVAHVEAGLRTDDIHSSFPDEMQRRVITVVSTFHFASTMAAVANVLAQGVRREHVFCTGNTGVDALMIIKEKIMHKEIMIDNTFLNAITVWRNEDLFIGLITLGGTEHTSEEQDILFSLINEVKNCAWIIVSKDHGNSIQVLRQLADRVKSNTVLLVDSISYKDMVYVLDNVDLVLTDSGALQEEAVSLGKPVLILRHKTERMDGVLAHQAYVVGFSPLLIMSGIEHALRADREKLLSTQQLFGDGHAAEKIVAFIQVRYSELTQADFVYGDTYYQQKEVE